MPVFLFPGQGAQFSGMGMDLYDADVEGLTGVRDLFSLASRVVDADVRDLVCSSAENLKKTDTSQIAITLVSLAVLRALRSRGITPSACAGFSLGEYAALVASGVLGEEDALRLVAARGRIMQDVCDVIAGAAGSAAAAGSATDGNAPDAPGMMAVLGLDGDTVAGIVSSLPVADCHVANFNSPLQTVVSGSGSALVLAEAAFKKAGARRVVHLKVAGPFHSPLMATAAERFSAVISGIRFSDPHIPLFSNVTGGRIRTGEMARECALAHITAPVRWTAEESSIAQLGITDLIEAGPGKVLCGLWADSGLPGVCRPYQEILAETGGTR